MTAPDSTPRILHAAWIAPMTGPVLRDAAIAIANGRVLGIGALSDLQSRFPNLPLESLGQVVLLPGLVNAHVHLELSDLTPGEPPRSFVDWLLQVMASGPPTGEAGRARLESATAAGIAQCLKFGVTTVGDITRNPFVTRPVLGRSPLSAVSFGEVTAMATRRTLLAERLAAAMQPTGTASVRSAVSAHAPYSIERGGYQKCLETAQLAGVPVATHLAESADETSFLADHTGPFKRLWETIGGWDEHVPTFAGGPIRFAEDIGLVRSPHTLLVHVNYASDAEIEALSAGRASVVYCPRTHAYFGHPPHRWRDMLAAGINVTVGTDSTASSPDLNLVDDLRLLRRIAPDMPPAEIWAMATRRAALALNLGDEIGSLVPGYRADLVAFRAESNDPLAEVLDGHGLPTGVWIGGIHIS